MSKPIVNNRINYQNAYARIIQHDLFLSQGVREGDSPTFGNLTLTGNATIQGNLYVEGNTSLFNTNVIEFEDNIILVNSQETASGVSLFQSGLEVDRGLGENFRIVYNEANSRVEVGLISNLQPVTIRESTPLLNGIMVWNDSTKRIESSNQITIPVTFTSTVNSSSSSTGSFILSGGLGVKKDMYMDGKLYIRGSTHGSYSNLWTDTTTNDFNLTSTQDINLTPHTRVNIPFNKYLSFGNNSQSIVANSLTNALNITSNGDIYLTPSVNQKIRVPNQIPITFSTDNEQIYTDSSNNIVIASSQDVYLFPNNGNANGKKVFVPVDTQLAFGNQNQYVIANSNNDLTIAANNNILLNPGSTRDVKIPIDAGIRFGSGRITGNSSDELILYSDGDIFLTPKPGFQVNLPVNVPLTFASDIQYIVGDSSGNITISPSNQLIVTSPITFTDTNNSVNGSTGSIHTFGGLGVTKDIYGTSSLIIKSNNSGIVQIKNNSNIDIFKINASSIGGNISIVSGNGSSATASLDITTLNALNAQSLIQLKANFDSTDGYMLGRGTSSLNNGRSLTVNLPDHSNYSNTGSRSKFTVTSSNCSTELFSVESETGNVNAMGQTILTNVTDSTSSSTGNLVVEGGVGIKKSIYTSGKIIQTVNDTTAYQLQDASSNILFNNDSIAKKITVNEIVEINSQDYNAFKITDTFTDIVHIDTIDKKYTSLLQHNITNTIESTDTSNGSVIIDGGVGIKKNLNVGGNTTFSNGVNMNNTKITNVLEPTLPQDAATKAYVDLVKQGIFVKDSVKAATTSDINLNSTLVTGGAIDTVTLVVGDRVLVKNQGNLIENGIYTVTDGTPVRSSDLVVGNRAAGIFTFVKAGDINASLGWICNSPLDQDTVGTHDLNFTQFTGLGQVTAGFGLIKDFNQLNINVDNVSLEATPVTGELRIKDTAVGTGLTGGSGTVLQTVTDQSHVTKLGTIDTGAWQASVIGIPYGGTGSSNFEAGNILFGNNANPISTDPNLYFDNINTRLGVGTNAPSEDLEIRSNNTTTFFINADSDANNLTARPEIRLSYNGSLNNAYIALTRDFNQFANHIYSDALVISNDQTTTDSRIQLATNQTARMTILSNGFVGINTSNPNVRLHVNGTMNVTDNIKFFATKPSTSITEGAVVISGGVSIGCPTNSGDINNGGALTVEGGASIGKDLFVGGSINSVTASANTFSYLTITATDEAINLTTGSFLTFGGITIQCTTDAMSVTDGGSLLTPGGAAIGSSLYVGNTVYALKDTFLGNLYMYSSANDNYIQPPDSDRNTNSFLPINFTKYNNTNANTLTIADTGIVLNNNHTIQIGGSLQNPDGYTLQYITNNFNIIPNNTTSNYNINVGTIGNYSNLNIYGDNSGQIRWQATQSNLLITHSSIQFNKVDSTGSIVLTSPMGQSSESYIQASGGNMILNLGTGSTGGQLITKLTNDVGDSSITFTPSNISSSTLVLTNNVYSTFEGPTTFTDRVEYSGNALHQTITNTVGNSLWVYMGQINTLGAESGYCEIDFNNGVNVSSNNLSGLKLMVAINNTTCIASHSHYGNIQFESIDKPICYIYNDTINDYHLFVKVAPNSQTNINVTSQRNTKFLLLREGTDIKPSGISSGYTNVWTVEYHTQHESTLRYTTGDLVVEKQAKINDNLPIIGYNNENTVASRDVGLLYQRYQVSNDSGSGDIVNGATPPQFIDSIPNQSTISNLSQIKFSNLTNSTDGYYVGWWIKIVSGSNTNQVRKITSYTGAQRIATLDAPFTSQNPNNGTTVNFFSNSYVVSYYDETNDTFAFGYTHSKPVNGIIDNNDNANLRVKSLYSTDTTVSTNASSGSVYLLGGISISNTNDAQSSSYGGTITTAGGIGIRKDLRVGNNIGLGTSGFTTEETIHIRKPTATSRFEHDTGSYSYIDFVENSTSSRYGIIFDSDINELCLTNTNSSQTPNNSNKALTINNLGYVGINTTTNVVSPLGINVNNFISTNSSTGYLGLIGGATNVNGNTVGSRILLCANDQDTNTSEGCLNLYAGNVNTGNVSIFTNDDIERVRVDHKGTVNITSTQVSDSSSNGSLIITGGIGVDCTQNATSISSGGALTVAGGVSINKNLYIGGDIFITGSFTAQGAITQPTITQYNTVNCTFIELFNNNLSVSGNFANLTFAFSVTPSNASENCTIEFSLPGRSNAFIKRFEIVSSCTGYTDDTDVVPLMNVLSYGELGTPRLKVKFQSVSTSIHHFQLICAYIQS
jgi:hypothetical protein